MALSDENLLEVGDQPPTSVFDQLMFEHPTLFEVSDRLEQLITAWEAFRKATEPLREIIRSSIDSGEPIPDVVRPHLSNIDRFMVDRQWVGVDSPFVSAILTSEGLLLADLSEKEQLGELVCVEVARLVMESN
jgi:hypothetical protein